MVPICFVGIFKLTHDCWLRLLGLSVFLYIILFPMIVTCLLCYWYVVVKMKIIYVNLLCFHLSFSVLAVKNNFSQRPFSGCKWDGNFIIEVQVYEYQKVIMGNLRSIWFVMKWATTGLLYCSFWTRLQMLLCWNNLYIELTHLDIVFVVLPTPLPATTRSTNHTNSCHPHNTSNPCVAFRWNWPKDVQRGRAQMHVW